MNALLFETPISTVLCAVCTYQGYGYDPVAIYVRDYLLLDVVPRVLLSFPFPFTLPVPDIYAVEADVSSKYTDISSWGN